MRRERRRRGGDGREGGRKEGRKLECTTSKEENFFELSSRFDVNEMYVSSACFKTSWTVLNLPNHVKQ